MEIIKMNKVRLIGWLSTDSFILQHVQSGNLITEKEYRKLKIIPDPETRIIDLLDLMVKKEDNVCIRFLELLKHDNVNESSPALRDWIKSVNITSETRPHAPQDPRPPQGNQPDNEEFLKRNRGKLIDKVKAVDRIVDDLNLTAEMAANVRAERTDQAQMRKVLTYTNSKKAAERLVAALYEHAADVMEELTSA